MENKEKIYLLHEQELHELLQLLRIYKRNKEANDVFEVASYVDGMEKKLDQAINELTTVRKQLDELQERGNSKSIKEIMSDVVTQLEKSCVTMKQQIIEVKQKVKYKVSEVVQSIKEKGETALYKMTEFLGIRNNLKGIRWELSGNLQEVNDTIGKIENFFNRMRHATNYVHNAGRVIMGKEETALKEKGKLSVEDIIKAPWTANKTIFTGLINKVDAATLKLEQLSERVEQRQQKKEDEISYKVQMQTAETNSFESNSEVFERFIEMEKEADQGLRNISKDDEIAMKR